MFSILTLDKEFLMLNFSISVPFSTLTYFNRNFSSCKMLSSDTCHLCAKLKPSHTDQNKTIADFLKISEFEKLKEVMQECKVTQEFRKNLDLYSLEMQDIETRKDLACEAFSSFGQRLSATPSTNPMLTRASLSIFAMDRGTVTFSGEGGNVAGRADYWTEVVELLSHSPTTRVHIISVGGGTGYDAELICEVFKKAGFADSNYTVVDPNPIRLLCKKDNFYCMNSSQFFRKIFKKEPNTRYIVHLGTTLNVVHKDLAVKILQEITEAIDVDDFISVLMVDKNQYKINQTSTSPYTSNYKSLYKLEECPENEAGFLHLLRNDEHHKTIVNNFEKFNEFTKNKLGLQKINKNNDFFNSTGAGSKQVKFWSYRSIKYVKEKPSSPFLEEEYTSTEC
jgi:hypothetical protein